MSAATSKRVRLVITQIAAGSNTVVKQNSLQKKEFNTFLLRGARPVDKPSKRSLGLPEESETSEFFTSNHDSEQFQKISMIFIVNLI